MSDLSDSSLREEDNDDIIAEYENRESNDEGGDVNRDVGGSDLDQSQGQDDEAEETAPRRIDPKTSRKRITLNPIPKLNTERLKGPKGIQTIEKYFEGFKFHGKGHEKTDLDRVMKRLEHWSHRLFPKLDFDDFLERLESLGAKKDLQTFMKKYRLDMITADNAVDPSELPDDESDKEEREPVDEFDILISEQIEKQKQVMHNNTAFDKLLRASGSQASQTLPTASQETSVTSNKPVASSELSDEIKEKIERNRQQAIQRRLARLEAMQEEAKKKKLEESKNTNISSSPSGDLSNESYKQTDETNTSQDVMHSNETETEVDNSNNEKESPSKNIVSRTESSASQVNTNEYVTQNNATETEVDNTNNEKESSSENTISITESSTTSAIMESGE